MIFDFRFADFGFANNEGCEEGLGAAFKTLVKKYNKGAD
jgi:hypothetical protein